jgi:DUF1365 family protein
MRSGLYECSVLHARLAPRRHRFAHRIFLFAIDLDELPALPRRLRLFSVDRPNLFSLRDRDHLPVDEPLHRPGAAAVPTPAAGETIALKARVVGFLRAHGIEAAGARVLLVTLPRVAGYGFNPVSFYFAFDPAGAPLAAIAEVTNTFREKKPYLLGPESFDAARRTFHVRVPKHFYVSPFSEVDVAFDFTLRVPDGRLAIRIDDYAGPERTLTSTLAGVRRELTATRLAWFALKYPLITLKVIGLIHAHALLLWLKRVPWFAKAARAGDQRQLYRPHRSLTSASDAA